jgi:hypothetical protein
VLRHRTTGRRVGRGHHLQPVDSAVRHRRPGHPANRSGDLEGSKTYVLRPPSSLGTKPLPRIQTGPPRTTAIATPYSNHQRGGQAPAAALSVPSVMVPFRHRPATAREAHHADKVLPGLARPACPQRTTHLSGRQAPPLFVHDCGPAEGST